MAVSDTYQFLFKEICFDSEHFSRLPAKAPNDHILTELRCQLLDRMWELIGSNCTKQQQEIMRYRYKENRTQKRTAELMNRNEAHISSAIWGVPIYKGAYAGKRYGGVINKMKRVMAEDSITQGVLREITNLD